MSYTQTELELIAIWTDILEGSEYPWVLFQFGTCIIIQKPEEDIGKQAIELMLKWAMPVAGTPSSKFSVSWLSGQGIPGCLVSCHHPDILTFVAPDEAPVKSRPEFTGVKAAVGSFGRKKRQWDRETLKIIHIEDKRH